MEVLVRWQTGKCKRKANKQYLDLIVTRQGSGQAGRKSCVGAWVHGGVGEEIRRGDSATRRRGDTAWEQGSVGDEIRRGDTETRRRGVKILNLKGSLIQDLKSKTQDFNSGPLR